MKKPILVFVLYLITLNQAWASTKCFIAKEGDKIIVQEGECRQQHSPCSTFKIPISLMAYHENILVDETAPQWPYKEEYASSRDICKNSLNPSLWIKNSCIWYSQMITRQLGMAKFKQYVSKFDYGNQNVAGDKGQNNGLTHAWLSSSLAISPLQQVTFLEKLIASKLPVSLKAQEMTRKILFVQELPEAWQLFGKTGSGNLTIKEGSLNPDRQIGWFVGWLQKGERQIIFAHYIEDETSETSPAGKRAKEMAIEKLMNLPNITS